MEKREIEKQRKDHRAGKYANVMIVFQSAKATLRLLANAAYVLMFLNITIISFLNTTMIWWGDIFGDIAESSPMVSQILMFPYSVLLVIVIVQYLCSDDYNWKEYTLVVVLVLIVYFGPTRNRIESVWNYILLILGARKLSFQKLLRIYVAIQFVLIILTMLASRQGWVKNLVYTAREGRNSYGFVYPTDCAAHFLFAALCYWTLRKNKFHSIESIVFFVFGMVAWFGCKARFSTVLLALLTVTACVYCFLSKRMGEDRWNQMLSGHISALLVLMPLLCNLGIHILSMIYTSEQKWMVWFNSVVSARLSLVKRGIDVYGFRLWGNDILMQGNGGETVKQMKYYYIDSSFMQISLLYGTVLLSVVLFLFTLACLKARQNKEWVLLIALVFTALHALFEHHAFDPAYNILLLSAFARLQPEAEKKRRIKEWIYKNREDKNGSVI